MTGKFATRMVALGLGLQILLALTVVAEPTHYVNVDSTHPASPFAGWETAATNIQNAVDVAGNGDVILVTNGNYLIASEIVVTNAITVRSVGGCSGTTVNAQSLCRVFNVGHTNAVVEGFTIINGVAGASSGGGVLLAGTLRHSVVASNTAGLGGGVAFSGPGTLQNCLIVNNVASYPYQSCYAGGVSLSHGGTIQSCTIAGNAAEYGGGLLPGSGYVRNTIVYGNSARFNDSEWSAGDASFDHCCANPLPAGTDNVSSNPAYMNVAAGDYRLQYGSACVDSGLPETWMTNATDLRGKPRLVNGQTDMGAFQHSVFIPLTVVSAPGGVQPPAGSNFFDEGTLVECSAPLCLFPNTETQAVCMGWTGTGDVPASGSGTNTAPFALTQASSITWKWDSTFHGIHYVDVNSTNPMPPFATLATASTNIQVAVNLALSNSVVLVEEGVYALPTTIAVDKSITLRSLHGARRTIIDGQQTNRCFSVSNNGTVDGFTITRGSAGLSSWTSYYNGGVGGGGGVELRQGLVCNCIIVSNAAYNATNSVTIGDVVGGGVRVRAGGVLRNCLIVNNGAYGDGTKARYVVGGGVFLELDGLVENCTIASNTVTGGRPGCEIPAGGGVFSRSGGILRNTISFFNAVDNYYGSSTRDHFHYLSDPCFVDPAAGNYHLFSYSPCRQAGINQSWMDDATDLDGKARRGYETVNIGAYDNHPLVLSVNSTYGPTTPSGVNTYPSWSPLTNSAPVTAFAGFTQFVCKGWSLSGNEPQSGSTHSFGMLLTNNATLTWNWEIGGFLLSVSADAGGSVDGGGWYTNGALATVCAVPPDGHIFANWTGDVPLAETNDNPVTFTIDHPQVAVAHFKVGNDTHYADAAGTHPTRPYTSWEIASTNLNDAVEAASGGDTVLVATGRYPLRSQIVITRALSVRSAEGPTVTTIDGLASNRCFYLGHTGAVVNGFTITGGSTNHGGAVYFSGGGVMQNCVITGNVATAGGGGAFLSSGGTLQNCMINSNTAAGSGGGICLASGGLVENSLVVGNSSGMMGGGVYLGSGGTLQNCTISFNTAVGSGGGVCCDAGGLLRNTIVRLNAASHGGDYWMAGSGYNFVHCNSSSLMPGTSNMISDPQFVNAEAGNFRLGAESLCIDAGSPVGAPVRDVEGAPRPLDGRAINSHAFDIGAFEFMNPDADSDHDGVTDGAEDTAGTGLLDPSSRLELCPTSVEADGGKVLVRWWSVSNHYYNLLLSTNLAAGFEPLMMHVPASSPMNTYTDSAPYEFPRFYQIEVEP